MYCTQCGEQLTDDSRFCSRCGGRTGIGRMTHQPRSLMLDKRNKKIAGVCAGFARYFEEDVTLVRVVWLVVALTTGFGFLGYLAAWIIMPSDRGLQAQGMQMPQPQGL
jgi:phage shock protein C